MNELQIMFLMGYVIGGVMYQVIDYALSWYKRRRRAKAVARRWYLLQEFAQGNRSA